MEQLFKRENIFAILAFLGLLVFAIYIPLGLLALMFLSIPFIYLAKKNSEQQYFVLFGIVLFIAFILASAVGLFLTILAASVSYTIVRFMNNKSFIVTYAYSLLVALANILLLIIVSRWLFEVDFTAYYMDQIKLLINAEQGIFAQFSPEQLAELIQSYTALIESIATLIPFLLIMAAAIYVIVNYYMATKILQRFSLALPSIPSPREWGFPKSVIYAYLVVALLYLLSGSFDFLYILTLNLFQIFSVILIIQGIAFIYIFIERRKISKQWMFLAVFGIFLPYLNQVIQVIGIIDLAFGLRDRIKQE